MLKLVFIAFGAVYALIFLWLYFLYRKEVKLEKLRKYDRKSKIEAMKENRIRIDHD
jgi:hypothetical protein